MIEDFYDQLAPYYKWIYPDWEASLVRQSGQLDALIREYVQGQAHTILDAACGIGTQSLGLAALGYTVTASDISLGEIRLAQAEAERRGLSIEFAQADMRQVWQVFGRSFDAVIACDNALPTCSVMATSSWP